MRCGGNIPSSAVGCWCRPLPHRPGLLRRSAQEGLGRLTQKSVEEVHAAVGRGELPVKDVIRAIVPDAELVERAARRASAGAASAPGEEGWFNLAKVIGLKFRWPGSGGGGEGKQDQVLPIRGLRNDVPVKFEEGGAVPGDRIVGVLSDGEGIRIFQIHSPQAQGVRARALDRRDVGRRPGQSRAVPGQDRLVTALNEPGSLAQIAQVIGEADGNIDNVRMLRRARDFTEMADRAGSVGPRPP